MSRFMGSDFCLYYFDMTHKKTLDVYRLMYQTIEYRIHPWYNYQSCFICIICILDDEFIAELRLPSLLLSKRRWSFLRNGAFVCLSHVIKSASTIDVHCLNNPSVLSVRYVSLKDTSTPGSILLQLRNRTSSLWLFSDGGKFISYEETVLSSSASIQVLVTTQ